MGARGNTQCVSQIDNPVPVISLRVLNAMDSTAPDGYKPYRYFPLADSYDHGQET